MVIYIKKEIHFQFMVLEVQGQEDDILLTESWDTTEDHVAWDRHTCVSG